MSIETDVTPLPSGSDHQLKDLLGYIHGTATFDTSAYDDADPSQYYSEATSKRHAYDKHRQFNKSWRQIVKAKRQSIDPELNTGELLAIKNLTDKINSGELYATEELMHEIGERAVALVAYVDATLPPLAVESTLLRVVAVDPTFRDEADRAIQQMYSNREEIDAGLDTIIHDTVRKTAEVASHPNDYIDPDTLEGATPSVDRILEEALTYATTPRITRAILKKQWAEEDNENQKAS